MKKLIRNSDGFWHATALGFIAFSEEPLNAAHLESSTQPTKIVGYTNFVRNYTPAITRGRNFDEYANLSLAT